MLANAISNIINVGTPAPHDDFWYSPTGGVSSSGVVVTDDVALSVSTVFGCVRVLSDALGVLPLHIYETDGNGEKQRATDHDFYSAVHSQPNVWQTPIDWKSMGVAHMCLRGNFYSEIVPPRLDWPQVQLVPRHPDRITVKQLPSGRLRYTHTDRAGVKRELNESQMLHVKLLCLDEKGILGASPIAYARNSIGLTKSRQGLLSSMFSGGGFIKYVLKTTKRLGKEGRSNFRDGWRDLHGQNGQSFSPPILEDDMDIKTLGMNADDMQAVESEQMSAIEICQYFGVPPHMVHILNNATYSNIEHQGIAFKTLHLQPWATRFEQAIRSHFEFPERYEAEFLMDALLRGDTASRYEAHTKSLGGRPFMTLNEVRAKENLPPVDGGDEIAEPLNMQVPGEPGKQNRDQPEQVSGPPQEQPEEPQAATIDLRPIIMDTSQRIVTREVRALRTKWAACKGDQQKWHTSAREWFEKHRQYVADSIQPIATASDRSEWGCGAFVQAYATTSLADVIDDPVVAFEEWGKTKATTLAESIEKELQCTIE